MTDETVEFSVAQRDAGDGAPGATAAFPYDHMTVERFREAFPRARWRDDLGAWFVPGNPVPRLPGGIASRRRAMQRISAGWWRRRTTRARSVGLRLGNFG